MWAAGCVFVCLLLDATLPYPGQEDEDGPQREDGLLQEGDKREDGLLRRILSGATLPSLPVECVLHSAVRDCCKFEAAHRISASRLHEDVLSIEAALAVEPGPHGPLPTAHRACFPSPAQCVEGAERAPAPRSC